MKPKTDTPEGRGTTSGRAQFVYRVLGGSAAAPPSVVADGPTGTTPDADRTE